jgi:hypothetical protein
VPIQDDMLPLREQRSRPDRHAQVGRLDEEQREEVGDGGEALA